MYSYSPYKLPTSAYFLNTNYYSISLTFPFLVTSQDKILYDQNLALVLVTMLNDHFGGIWLNDSAAAE
jgi:hypothetical protein